jgi:RNA polymerase sigma-70 factor (ECF subfamily)
MLQPTIDSRPLGRMMRGPPRGAMSDLLTRIATDRSDQAFRSLFAEYGPRVRNFMLRQGVDAELAEELAQETLIAVWRKAALYSSEKGCATTWIYTIARNLRTDHIRRQRIWQELTDEQTASLASDEQPADEAIAEEQRRRRVQEVLRDLPEEQVEVVRLAFMEGLPHSEIAIRLSLPLGTVKSRIRLAYQKLRTSLENVR